MYASTMTYKTASELNVAMAGVYKHMMLAVATSMLVSYFVSNSPTLMTLFFGTALKWVIIFAPLVAIFALGFAIQKVSKEIAFVLLHGFAAIMGLSLSTIFAAYTSMSIVTAFLGATVLFAVMSFYGYFTKKDLNNLGKWLFVGLIAIVIASIINVFIGSTVAQMTISALAIIVFTGLTVYDTQRIREDLSVNSDGNVEVTGALSLYLNFINLFISLLQLFGNKNE